MFWSTVNRIDGSSIISVISAKAGVLKRRSRAHCLRGNNRNKKPTSTLVAFFILLLFPALLQARDTRPLAWKTLLPGFKEARLVTKDSQENTITLQLYKIDLKKFKVQVAQAKDYQQKKMSAQSFVKQTGAVLAVNGGFFDPSYQSLGLIVQNGKVLNPLRPVSWWGVFSVDQNHLARVAKVKDFQLNSSIEMAIQAGPRLIEDRVPVAVKPNVSQKTFLGVTQDNELIIGVTDACVVDAVDFVTILAQELALKSALNLDGGGSTQAYAKAGAYEKNLPGFTEVANGVVVIPR